MFAMRVDCLPAPRWSAAIAGLNTDTSVLAMELAIARSEKRRCRWRLVFGYTSQSVYHRVLRINTLHANGIQLTSISMVRPPGPGDLAARVRDKDWSQTPLGAIEQWPASLRIAIVAVLDSPLPMIVLWGPQLIQVYNDAYLPILGERHPTALGQPTRACWPEVWDFNEPIYRRVQVGGERVEREDQEYVIKASGVSESRFFTITYTPARDESGTIVGVTVVAVDTTQRVVVERERLEMLLE
jgi:PAS domain-containing protein